MLTALLWKLLPGKEALLRCEGNSDLANRKGKRVKFTFLLPERKHLTKQIQDIKGLIWLTAQRYIAAESHGDWNVGLSGLTVSQSRSRETDDRACLSSHLS